MVAHIRDLYWILGGAQGRGSSEDHAVMLRLVGFPDESSAEGRFGGGCDCVGVTVTWTTAAWMLGWRCRWYCDSEPMETVFGSLFLTSCDRSPSILQQCTCAVNSN